MREHAVLVEACVNTAEQAVAAVKAGATRIELCGFGDGGTTPSPDTIERCLKLVSVPVHVMIRPRTGNFIYTDDELADMVSSIGVARDKGCSGVVFGVLENSGRVAKSESAFLVSCAGGMHTVFHRAFDSVPNQIAALETLAAIGVKSVLTSGGAATALLGADMLFDLVNQSAARVSIMAGGSVRGTNVREIVERAGVSHVHARGTDVGIIADITKELKS